MVPIRTFRQTPAPERLPRTKAASYISTYLSAGRELWKLSLMQAQADMEKDMARQKYLQQFILDLEKTKAQLQKTAIEQNVKIDLAEFDAGTQAVRDEAKFLRERELQFARDQGLSARQAAGDEAALLRAREREAGTMLRAREREAGMDRRLGTVTANPAFAKDPNESIVQQAYAGYVQSRNPLEALVELDAQLRTNPAVNRAEADISVYKMLESIARDQDKEPTALARELASAAAPGSTEESVLLTALAGRDLATLKAAGGKTRSGGAAPSATAPATALPATLPAELPAVPQTTGGTVGRAQSVRAADVAAPERPDAPGRVDVERQLGQLEASRLTMLQLLGAEPETDLIGKARSIFDKTEFFPSGKVDTESIDFRKAEAQKLAEDFLDSFGSKKKRQKLEDSPFGSKGKDSTRHLDALRKLYDAASGDAQSVGPQYGKYLISEGVDRTSDAYSKLMAAHLIMSEMYGTPDFEDLKSQYFDGLPDPDELTKQMDSAMRQLFKEDDKTRNQAKPTTEQ